MNTVSLNKTRTQTIARVAGLLVLAALAIAFFALPMSSYAMGCKGGKNKNKNAVTKPVESVQFVALVDENGPATTNGAKLTSAPVPAVPNTENIKLIPAAQVTQLVQFNWIKATDSSNQEVYVTLADTRGDGWLTSGPTVKVTGLNGIKIKPAPTKLP